MVEVVHEVAIYTDLRSTHTSPLSNMDLAGYIQVEGNPKDALVGVVRLTKQASS